MPNCTVITCFRIIFLMSTEIKSQRGGFALNPWQMTLYFGLFFFLFLNHCFLIFYFSVLAPFSPLFVPLRHPSTPSSPLALIPWYFLCSHGPFLSSAPLSGQRRGIHLSENERAAQIPRLPSQHSVAPCLHTDIFQPTGMSAARGEKAS